MNKKIQDELQVKYFEQFFWEIWNQNNSTMPLGLATFTRNVTKRAQRGLYAGKKVLSGNNVSEDGGNRQVDLLIKDLW